MKNTAEMIEYRHQIGERVQLLREQNNLSQTQLSLMTGVDRSYLSRIERGIANASIDKLIAIAQAFDLSISEMLYGIAIPKERTDDAFIIPMPKHPNANYDQIHI